VGNGGQTVAQTVSTGGRQHGLTIIYTSSGLDDVIGLADTIYVLDQGRTVLSGTPREILQHADEITALDVALPEAAQVALALQDIIPTIRTDVLNLEELEAELNNERVTK
jgi:energy-coupling factor transport system ATP-binding protein